MKNCLIAPFFFLFFPHLNFKRVAKICCSWSPPSPLISDEQKEERCLTRVLEPARLVYRLHAPAASLIARVLQI